MRNAYISALYDLAEKNPNVLALVADNGAIVYDKFRSDFPEQFVNFGIAEANMVTVAAGLASCGKIPFAYTIAGFLTMRAYEQVRNDVCLQRQNVKLVGVGAGVSYGTLGPTHHATEDIAIMRVLPYITIIAPASPKEAYEATIAASKINGPTYIRLETTKEPEIYDDTYRFTLGRGVQLIDGNDLTVLATGSIVYDAMLIVRELQKQGVKARLINIHTLKPLDNDIISNAAAETGAILTVEEHSIIGGLGSAVEEVLIKDFKNSVVVDKIGFNDSFCKGYGSHQEVKAMNGLSREEIRSRILALLEKKQKGLR